MAELSILASISATCLFTSIARANSSNLSLCLGGLSVDEDSDLVLLLDLGSLCGLGLGG